MKRDERPQVGPLTVPYMVDATQNPIDFKIVDADHVKRCATARRCGVCGGKIRKGPFAFIGPNDGRDCFADPWMHPFCANVAMAQCPFLTGKMAWRDPDANRDVLLHSYARNMTKFLARDGVAHRDPRGAWHFKAIDIFEGGGEVWPRRARQSRAWLARCAAWPTAARVATARRSSRTRSAGPCGSIATCVRRITTRWTPSTVQLMRWG